MGSLEKKLLKEIKDFLDECYAVEDSPEGNDMIVKRFYERWANDESIQGALKKIN